MPSVGRCAYAAVLLLVGYDDGNAMIWGSHAGLTADTTAWQDLSEGSSGSTGQ